MLTPLLLLIRTVANKSVKKVRPPTVVLMDSQVQKLCSLSGPLQTACNCRNLLIPASHLIFTLTIFDTVKILSTYF
jgi:hypothetical protein